MGSISRKIVDKMRDKFFASMVHFVFNIIVVSLFYLLVVRDWYPGVHFFSNGGWSGGCIVLLVDLVLGPVLTFVVFDRLKPIGKLVFDFVVIFVLQVFALAYGALLMHQERPIALAYFDNRLVPVFSGQLNDLMNNKALSSKLVFDESILDYGRGYGELPIVYIPVKNEMTKNELDVSLSVYMSSMLLDEYNVNSYRKWSENFYKLQTDPKIFQIIEKDSLMKDELGKILDKSGGNINDFNYIPMIGKTGNQLAVFDGKGHIIQWLTPADSSSHDF